MDYGADFNLRLPQNYDFMISTDHSDLESVVEMDHDPYYIQAKDYVDSISVTSESAEILWEYDGERSTRGMVRHAAMFLWREDTTEEQKNQVFAGLEEQKKVSHSIRSFSYGMRVAPVAGDFDWILEAHFDDVAGLMAYFNHPIHHEVSELNHGLTKDPLTARVQARMLYG